MVFKRAALEVLAGDVLQRLPAGPEVDAVSDFGIARHRAHLGVQKMRYEAGDGIRAITVSASMPTKISSPRRCSSPKLRASALPELGLVRMRTRPLAASRANALARDFEGPVAGSVVNHDDAQIGIVRIECGTDGPHDNFLFVVGRDQHRDRGKIVGRVAGSSIAPGPEPVEDGESADEKQRGRSSARRPQRISRSWR